MFWMDFQAKFHVFQQNEVTIEKNKMSQEFHRGEFKSLWMM